MATNEADEPINAANELTQRQTVDINVSRVKFERELSTFIKNELLNRERGIFLISAAFPDIVLSFSAFRVRPVIIAFTVRINFSNYDLDPPSIQFIDPITGKGISATELSIQMSRIVPGFDSVTLPSGEIRKVPKTQGLIVAHPPHNIPFLCLPGVREYHNHPFHTNDSWLARRGGGEGSLGFLVEQLYKYGTNPITKVTPKIVQVMPTGTSGMLVDFNGIAFQIDPNLLSL